MSQENQSPGHANAFFNSATTFRDNIRLYDSQNSDGSANFFIYEYFLKYAVSNTESLIRLSDQCPILRKYCYLDDDRFRGIWDDILKSGVPFSLAGMLPIQIKLLPQAKLHSFDLIKGHYWYVRRDLLKAVSAGSLMAGCELLDQYLEQKETLSFAEIEQHLKRLAEIHLAPGELSLAKLYWHAEKYEECSACITRANDKLKQSTSEMQNANVTLEEMMQLIQGFQAQLEKHLTSSKQAPRR